VTTAEEAIKQARDATGYSPDAYEGGVEELIAYKDQLEEEVTRLAKPLDWIARWVPREDDWGSAAGFMESVAGLLDAHAIDRPEHYEVEAPR